MSSTATMTRRPPSDSSWHTGAMAASKNCASSMATTWVSVTTLCRISTAVPAVVASSWAPECEATRRSP